MADASQAEIAAGAQAAVEAMTTYHAPGAPEPLADHLTRAVLRVVLPDRDARVREQAWREAAQEIRDRLIRTAGWSSLSYRDGASDAARLLDNMADGVARATTTGGECG